jgi:hypothetical protein
VYSFAFNCGSILPPFPPIPPMHPVVLQDCERWGVVITRIEVREDWLAQGSTIGGSGPLVTSPPPTRTHPPPPPRTTLQPDSHECCHPFPACIPVSAVQHHAPRCVRARCALPVATHACVVLAAPSMGWRPCCGLALTVLRVVRSTQLTSKTRWRTKSSLSAPVGPRYGPRAHADGVALRWHAFLPALPTPCDLHPPLPPPC